MASFWFWFVTCIAALIVGAVSFLFLYLVGAWLMDRLKFKINKIPKKRPEVTKWIKENKEITEDAGREEFINKSEEVLKNDRRQRDKFREFDKLRNEYFKGSVSESKPNDSGTTRGEQSTREQLLPPTPTRDVSLY